MQLEFLGTGTKAKAKKLSADFYPTYSSIKTRTLYGDIIKTSESVSILIPIKLLKKEKSLLESIIMT